MKSKSEEADHERLMKTAKINSQLGIAYLEKGNIQRSKQKLLLALRQAPTIPEPWYSMGYFYEATGNKQEASIHYLKALEIAPTRGDAQNNYGTFLCRSGEYEKSIQHFLLATKDPGYLDVASAYENAGSCAMRIPDRELAKEYFEQALLQDSARQTSLYKLAEMNYDDGDYTAAKEKIKEFSVVTTPTMESMALSLKIDKHLAQTSLAQTQHKNFLRKLAFAKKNKLHKVIVSQIQKKKHTKVAALHAKKIRGA
jgi:type IV pilus assembly protein PilF